MGLLRKIGIIIDRINFALVVITAIALAALMFIIAYEVFGRHFLNQTTEWLIPVAQFVLLYVIFSSAAWVLSREGHVRMDLLLLRLQPRGKAVLNTTTSIIAAIMCLFLVWGGIGLVIDQWGVGYAKSELLNIPSAPFIAILPTSFFLLFIQFLRRSYSSLRSHRELSDTPIQKVTDI